MDANEFCSLLDSGTNGKWNSKVTLNSYSSSLGRRVDDAANATVARYNFAAAPLYGLMDAMTLKALHQSDPTVSLNPAIANLIFGVSE